MRILQLVSDWKWTGPAEPMVVLSRALRRRGHAVELVCPEPPPGAVRSLWSESVARGLVPVAALPAARGAWRVGDGEWVRRIAGWATRADIGGPFDIVQCWHSRDHVLAARALGGSRSRRTRIVRVLARDPAIAAWPWNRWLFGPACDGLLCASAKSAAAQRRVRSRGSIAVLPGAVEWADPNDPGGGAGDRSPEIRRAERTLARRALGVPEDAFLIGVVARIQSHRRFDLLLDAIERFSSIRADVRLVVLGRGTQAEALLARPVRERGLDRCVVLAGHRGDDYRSLYAAMDVATYLVPGSDGSCRALLEAAALGLPMVGTRRGAIGEIIVDRVTGLLVDETPEALADAWARLAADPIARRSMGDAARRDAVARFAPDRAAALCEAYYEEIVRSAPTSSR